MVRAERLGLIAAAQGLHQLGGHKPPEFRLPVLGPVSFQYLGYMNNRDDAFAWLPDALGLTFPLYSQVQRVFLDYSDPLAPQVFNRDEVAEAETVHGTYINPETWIEYVPQRFLLTHDKRAKQSAVTTGSPRWMQDKAWPTCPLQGTPMRFVMQISSTVAYYMPVKASNIRLLGPERLEQVGVNGHVEYYSQERASERIYKVLNFWGDGHLYVFFAPETRMACYLIQNS